MTENGSIQLNPLPLAGRSEKLSIMKILVIGGSGLIGSKVVANLRQLGYEVLVRIAQHRHQHHDRRGIGRMQSRVRKWSSM
jgi:uncharacterized protein YbjT (DUF2867 family)